MAAESEHGTLNRYRKYACRCERCRDAERRQAERQRAKRREVVARRGLPDHVSHGLSAALNWGCKCAACNAAVRERNRSLYDRVRAGETNHRGGVVTGCPCEPCRAGTARRMSERNASSKPSAHNDYKRWTSAEMQMVYDARYPDAELARILGRTIAAITTRRNRISRDPKWAPLIDAEGV